MDIASQPPKRCFTVSAWALQSGKVLLIKHKKLGIWLAPGGHVEVNELPHQAAEREFWEETGMKGNVVSAYPLIESIQTQSLPLPFFSGLHWINKPRGRSFCEQHFMFSYFATCAEGQACQINNKETQGMKWIERCEIPDLETTADIKNEAYFVFDHFPVQF